jgi:arylsulfatase A-like enzyme
MTFSAVHQRAHAKDNRPNILFIMSDDHGYQALSCYGSKVNKTPNLDRIAKGGMRFDRCFVTNSICGPCRAVILTGKYSHLNGFTRNGNTFDGGQQTVAKLLQAAGYQTAVVGKWHLRSDPTGFDYWHILQGQGPYYNPPMKTPTGVVRHSGYTTDIITDLALDWLKNKRKTDQPFYLVYQHKAPHRNWQPGPKYLTRYDDVTIAEPVTLFDNYEGRGSAAKNQQMTIERHLNPKDLKLVPPNLTPEQRELWDAAYEPKNKAFLESQLDGKDLVRWKYQRYVKDYLRCVDSVDANVGRVLDYLDESGLAENTVVFYTSDQGWYLGEHGWFDKRWMYEESFRTPLMIRWPGVTKPGSVTSDMAMNLDFAETFLEIAGQPIPQDMQGRSLLPILQQKTPDDWRDAVYYHYYEYPGAHSVRRHLGVRTDRYKLIHFYNLNEWELYDLQEDPHELTSVYSDPAYADVRAMMELRLTEIRKQYKDDGPLADLQSERARNVRNTMVRRFGYDQKKPQVLLLSGQGPAVSEPSSKEIDPSLRPFTVGGWLRTAQPNGVFMAHGGESLGYSLYLQEGVPTFVLRSDGQQGKVTARAAIKTETWVHIAASLDAGGEANILINGEVVATKKLFLIGARPSDGFTLGADSGSLVGDYTDVFALKGEVADVRVYWGKTNKRLWRQWLQSKNNLP